MNIFKGSAEHRTHLSVGAVVYNADHKILVHHWDHLKALGANGRNVYLLMRETVEPGESLEQTVVRGLAEEFGATASIIDYLGSMVSYPGYQKTTLYFLCELNEFSPQKRAKNDEEGDSKLMFKTIEELIPRMEAQALELKRDDMDESGILKIVRDLYLAS